ncbi:protein mono-ADP-ribosyltransferase PARP4 [Nelusetta ayraudi]|uniref:protein mono-ADP-ribosyltransferase PARP4 n=1 Tax=Nelusetta ayraudi TaxID=303726 RepID=UPI003F6E59AD
MNVFENCTVLLDLKNTPSKEKKRLKTAVTDNGGSLCLLVNEQCTFVVTSNVSKLSQLRRIQKLQTPVVGIDYVFSCVEKGALLPVDEYRLDLTTTDSPETPKTLSSVPLTQDVDTSIQPTKPVEAGGSGAPKAKASLEGKDMEKYRTHTETDSDLQSFPEDFQVAKYAIFEKENGKTWCVVELQSCSVGEGRKYRVVRYWKEDISTMEAAVKDTMVFLDTSEEALECFKSLKEKLTSSGLQLRDDVPLQSHRLGSAPLQQLLLEERLSTGQLSQSVGQFVSTLWCAALSRLTGFISAPVEKLSLNDVNRAEGLLLRVHRKLKDGDETEVVALLGEVSSLLSAKLEIRTNLRRVSATLDLCQLLRDILSLNEVAVISTPCFSLGKYRALRCSIEEVPSDSAEFQDVAALLDSDVKIHQVMRVCRGVELQTFTGALGNVRPLLHASVPSNFVGILSRGLLLPHVGVKKYGVERTDAGNLGSGIYFSDAFRCCLKYTMRHTHDGTRLLVVCDVALGKCHDVRKRDLTLTRAPDGYHSVHGVRSAPSAESDFEDDEYVVYSPDQVKLKYVVLFNMEGDRKWESGDSVDVEEVESPSPPAEVICDEVNGLETVTNPLEDVTAGLLDSAGQQLPLQAVHVKCKLMDLLSQVVIFQKYTNQSAVPIEAKYVFPLGECAAVCGFEAFINGKHVVGQVKEKETARKEYKKAIQKGHGAYLMDQDAPDVFTISVGNLPPGATVLIKVTFVSELIVRDGSILFTLPGSVAPWQESAALNQTTQVSVEKVCVTDADANQREFTLDVSVEMPFEISSLNCLTHNVKIKRTDCKAVVSVLPGQVMDPEGFQLSVSLSQAHLPRMWVEKHPDKMSQACMLVFYPEFDAGPSSACEEVVIVLDTSESMKGEPLRLAQRIAMQVLQTLDASIRVNIVLFGTDYSEAFWTAQPLGDVHKEATETIRRLRPRGGSTELWRPLQALSLLPPSRGVRNLLLLSDGHVQNAAVTLRLVRDNVRHSRLFTCGLSSTANRHTLRALAEAGGGAFEFFDVKTKHNWAEKVASQVKRMASPGCSSVSVKWQQFSSDAPVPVQAPKQLHALFNDCHTLVYGFVPHCTQATLLGDLSGQELKTIVSTTELQKTKGTFLHKLTARALIQDFEDGNLDSDEVEHEGKKAELKHFIIELSKEFSILSQFTSFVAIEERDSEEEGGVTDIPQLIAEEDVDFLPYVSWPSTSPEPSAMGLHESCDENYLDLRDWDGMECEEYSADHDEELQTDSDMGMGLMSPDSSSTIDSSSESRGSGAAFSPSSDLRSPPDSAPILRKSARSVDEEALGPSLDSECPWMVKRSSGMGLFSLGYSPTVRGRGRERERERDPQIILNVTSPGYSESRRKPQRMSARSVVEDALGPSLDSKCVRVFRRSSGMGLMSHDYSPTIDSSSESQGGGAAFSLSSVLGSPPGSAPILRKSARSVDEEALSRSLNCGLERMKSGACRRSGPRAAPPASPPAGAPAPPPAGAPAPPCGGPVLPRLAKSRPAYLGASSTVYLPQSSAASPLDLSGSLSFRESSLSVLQSSLSAICAAPPQPLSFAFGASAPPPPPPATFGASPPLPLSVGFGASGPPPPATFGASPPLPLSVGFGTSPPPPPPATFGAAPPHPLSGGFGASAPPPPSIVGAAPSSIFAGFHAATPPPATFGASPPPPPPPASFGAVPPPPPHPSLFDATRTSLYADFGAVPPPPPHPSLFDATRTSLYADFGAAPQPHSLGRAPTVSYGRQQQSRRRIIGATPPVRAFPISHPSEDVPSTFGRQGASLSGLIEKASQEQKEGLVMSSPWKAFVGDAKRRKKKLVMETELLDQSESDGPGWTQIFRMQHSDGFWEPTAELGELIDVNFHIFVEVFLQSKGIHSLGVKAHADIIRLVATLLVLQLMRVKKLEEGRLLRTLFSLDEPAHARPPHWQDVKRAVDWARWADQQYPCIYSRLEFGFNWESSTRQLLGYESVSSFSPLSGLNLQGDYSAVGVH